MTAVWHAAAEKGEHSVASTGLEILTAVSGEYHSGQISTH
jgi:hypothetical protein